MELLVTLAAIVVTGIISFALLQLQLRRQASDAKEQLVKESEMASARAKSEARHRIQVSDFEYIRNLSRQISRDFSEIFHDAGHIVDEPADQYYLQDAQERISRVRKTVRGDKEAMGEVASLALLAATDAWKEFFLHPNPTEQMRKEAFQLELEGSRALRDVVVAQGKALGNEDP